MKALWKILSLSIVLTITPVSGSSVYAEDTPLTYEDFEYSVENDGSITIQRYVGEDTEVVIPETIDGKPVRSIMRQTTDFLGIDYCTGNIFKGSSVTDVTIPDSIRYIAGNMYIGSNCRYHVSPEHEYLAVIDGCLFDKKEKRLISYYQESEEDTTYTVPEGIRVIGKSAFDCCKTLESITLPDTIEKIEEYAFSQCSSLSELELPETVTSIGRGAFLIPELSELYLPENVETIEEGAFHCGVVKVSPENDRYAEMDGVLYDKAEKKLLYYPPVLEDEVFTVPDGIEGIGTLAFAQSQYLKELNLPDSLRSVSTAGIDFQIMPELVVPAGVTEIGNGGFFATGDTKCIFIVSRGSYAAQYCRENEINYEYTDANDWLLS